MSQQFRIDSESLRDKLNSLLPSQARGSINVDLSGQTTIVPIVDLTETAEGSSLRQDLQRAFSHTASNFFNINNTTTDMANTPGYYEVFGNLSSSSSGGAGALQITDGATTKKIYEYVCGSGGQQIEISTVIVKLEAGDTLQGTSDATTVGHRICMRQIADVSGNLVNP